MLDRPTPSFVSHVADPLALEGMVRLCSVQMAGTPPDGIELPPDLRDAVPARQRDYLAGRHCARKALARLGIAASDIPRGPAGEPIWPAGIVGSITHAGDFASAAVARATDLRGLGIDTERLERFARNPGIARMVVLPRDEAAVRGLDDRLLPLVFSAKEALFKCLYPLTGRRFYFEAAALSAVDAATGAFTIDLTGYLGPGLEAGLRLQGRFAFNDEFVHVGVWLPHRHP